jgi:hypothetical protein
LEEGALDAFVVPIQMKKSRPGVLLTVLADPARREAMERVLFGETPTLGLRRRRVERSIRLRRIETVRTAYGEIRVKIGEGADGLVASPEFEDCRTAAERHGAPLRDVMLAAQRAWGERSGESAEEG